MRYPLHELRLRSSGTKGVAEAVAARGAELRHLPPYSPDLSPIEQMFAKLRALLREAALRSVDKL